jgi:hypothetical protein
MLPSFVVISGHDCKFIETIVQNCVIGMQASFRVIR